MTEAYDEDFGLEAFDAQWEETKAAEMKNLPDGQYTVSILKCYMGRTKEGGKPMLRWEFSVVLPLKFQGRKLFRNNVINPDGFPWLKKDLAILALKFDKISDLPLHCHEVLGKCIDVRVKNVGDRQNIYFERLISQTTGGMVDAPADTGTPF